MSDFESPYLTPKEAAKYLRMQERTINNMRYREAGPRYRKHGGKVIYLVDDLRAWSAQYDYGTGPKHSQTNEK